MDFCEWLRSTQELLQSLHLQMQTPADAPPDGLEGTQFLAGGALVAFIAFAALSVSHYRRRRSILPHVCDVDKKSR